MGDVYAAAFGTYWQAGWRGILPLPKGAKTFPPTGYTGNHGTWPSYADLHAWAEERPDGNVALRMPGNVLGVDVDAYGDKAGAASLLEAEQRWGLLPATWISTSRDDGTSGIRFYRIPDGRAWPNTVGPGIETVRFAHRYAVVWPSLHPEGRAYRWVDPNGETASRLPTPDELPMLPAAWIEGLTGNREAVDQPRADVGWTQAVQWLITRAPGDPCRAVTATLTRRITELDQRGGGRHDAALEGSQRLAYLAAEGHPGCAPAMLELRAKFLQVATDRRPAEAEAEFGRMLHGAVKLAAAQPQGDYDPCEHPEGGILPLGQSSLEPLGARDVPPPGQVTDNSAPGPDEQPAADTGEIPPSWDPIDLGPYIRGEYQPVQPGLLVRTDGRGLLYPGMVCDIHGESESGKSMVAQWAAAQLIQAGHPVLYIDYESDPAEIVHRLRLMGCDDTTFGWLTYIRPERSPRSPAEKPSWAAALAATYALAVLDGVTEALVQEAGSSKDNDQITAWHRQLPREIARKTGACVWLVDHVNKDTDGRGRFAIGGQAKLAALTGVSYLADVKKVLGVGRVGEIVLYVAKDRPGSIREHAGRQLADRTQEAARITVDSTVPNRIQITVEPPRMVDVESAEEDEPIRLEGLLGRLSSTLRQLGEPTSQSKVFLAMRSGANPSRATDGSMREMLAILVEEGFATLEDGPRNAKLYRHVCRYTEPPRRTSADLGVTSATPRSVGRSDPLDRGDTLRSAAGRVAAVPPEEVATRSPAELKTSPNGTTSAQRSFTVIDGQNIDLGTGEVIE